MTKTYYLFANNGPNIAIEMTGDRVTLKTTETAIIDVTHQPDYVTIKAVKSPAVFNKENFLKQLEDFISNVKKHSPVQNRPK